MKELTLKEISSSIKTGKTPPSKELKYYDGEINWYTPGDLTEKKVLSKSSRTITSLALNESKATLHKQGTLLIGCIGDIGKIGICKQDSSSNQQITGIYPIDGVDVDYLYYWFRGNKEQLASYANNSVVPILNNRILGTVKLPVPPLEEQKKIAAILDAADDYRQKTKALIDKYDQLTQSLFLDMFGDPVTNPERLPIIKLGELGKWQSGGTPSRKVSEFFNGKIPWLSSGELEKMYTCDSKEHISENAVNQSAAKIVETGSLLLGMYDTAALKSTISAAPLTCNQAIAFCRLDDNMVNTVYVYKILQLGREYYRRLQRGVRQKNLNLSMVKDIEILFPSLKLQNLFADRVKQIEKQKQQAEVSLVKAEELFSSLLQRAFKGELTN